MAATAVRHHIPWQLDFRLDTILDPQGVHILALGGLIDDDPTTGRPFPEQVACVAVLLHCTGTHHGDAFHIPLAFLLTDYLACEPMNPDTLDPSGAALWHRFAAEVRNHPELWALPGRNGAR